MPPHDAVDAAELRREQARRLEQAYAKLVKRDTRPAPAERAPLSRRDKRRRRRCLRRMERKLDHALRVLDKRTPPPTVVVGASLAQPLAPTTRRSAARRPCGPRRVLRPRSSRRPRPARRRAATRRGPPGDPDPPAADPRALRLVKPRAIFTFAVLTAEERGLEAHEVEAVDA